MNLICQTNQNKNDNSSETEEKFEPAKKIWDLERLYIDLVDVKGAKLTPTEKEYLRGLLLNYRPQEIAKQLCKEVRGVRVALTNLYRYVQMLCDPPGCKVNCRNITVILEAAGYKLPSSRQFQRKVFISCSPEKQTLKLAGQLYESLLAAGHTACMTGQTLQLLTEWCDRLDAELEECNYFILIYSGESAPSEIVIEELQRVRKLRDFRQEAKPTILAIRIGFSFEGVLNNNLCGYLNGIPLRVWRAPSADNLTLILELLGIIAVGCSEVEQLPGWQIARPVDLIRACCMSVEDISDKAFNPIE